MKTYHYFLKFSPYMNKIKARNRKEAMENIVALWGMDYDCNTVVILS